MNQEDHDLLISLDATITLLCKDIADFKNDIKEDIKDLKKCSYKIIEIDKKVESVPRWSQITTIIIILIGLFSGVISYNFNQDSKTIDKIDEVQKEIYEIKK